MAKSHKKAPHNTHTAITQTDLLLNAATKKNVPMTAHHTGMGSIIKISQELRYFSSVTYGAPSVKIRCRESC